MRQWWQRRPLRLRLTLWYKQAEIFFVPADKVIDEAQRLGATPFDVKGVELGHHGKECSFEAIVKKYNLSGDPGLLLLGKIVN